nr:hypothetical protein CFP56_18413 [Quercus suber]
MSHIISIIDDGPSHDGVSVNVAASHRPSEGDDGPSTHGGGSGNAAASHRPFEGDAGPSTHEDPAAPHRTTAADPPLEEGEWVDPPLEDDMESLAGSDDDQLARTASKEPEFNAQTDMRKPELKKGMKFPNSKAQGSKSTKTKQAATPQTASQPLSTRSQPAYRAFGQIASQPAPNNRSEATTQPLTRSRANWFSSSSQPSIHTPRETWDSLPSQPSASVSTSGVPSEGSGGATARRFKGRTTDVSRPAKFQVIGGKGKKVAGKGTKSNK